MKKLSAILLALLCVTAFSACGNTPPGFSSENFTAEPSPEENFLPGEETFSPPSEGELSPEPSEGELLPPEPSEGEISPEKNEPPERADGTYLLVTADGLNVRAGAGTEFPSLGKVMKGELLSFRGEKDGWRETEYRGRTAFVSARYTSFFSLEEGDERTEKIVSEGVRLLGVPYVYGATRFHDGGGVLLKGFSEEKFDCSSLMQYIFCRGAGVLLGVTTRIQVKQGVHVGRESLTRGDLMFFTNASRKDRTGVERVGHVALYLGGNYILHTSSDFAKIEQISPLRWSYFLEGRRV